MTFFWFHINLSRNPSLRRIKFAAPPENSHAVASSPLLCLLYRGGALSALPRLPRLRALSMQDCALLSDHALACLAGAPALEQLLLDMCERITDAGAAASLLPSPLFSSPPCSVFVHPGVPHTV